MYTNPIFIIIFASVIGSWAISEILLVTRQNKQRGDKKQDRGSMLLSLGIGLVGLVLSFLLPMLLPQANIWQPGAFFAGLSIAIIGISWRWYSILTLRQYFTSIITIQKDHVVVQHGPYRWIRHPSYTGALFLAGGIGAMLGNWVSLAVLVGSLLVGLLYRIPVEEQALCNSLGKPYKEYMQRTKRLVPFLF